MKVLVLSLAAALMASSLPAADQLTVHKVTLGGSSGAINGKIVGVGDYLVFIDDDRPEKSFLVQRGEIKTASAGEGGTVLVEMARPVMDRNGTRSNLEIRLIDPNSTAMFSKWIGVPVERGRTETVYSLGVRHDHKGQGGCEGKLIADDNRLRFESVTEADHSRSWAYGNLQRFEAEKDNSIIKVAAVGGEAYQFNVVNGSTAGAMHSLVSEKIIAARPR